MITGYFYTDTMAKHKEKQQIKKIFFLMLKANLLFLIWNLTLILSQKGDLRSYLKAIFTGKNLERFLLLNESPFAGHLWYLGAILYVLLIVSLTDAFQCRKIVYYLTPVLLAADLLFGKYSLLVLGREYPYIFVRNFLCVGIPYFCIGNLIKEKRYSERWNQNVLLAGVMIFAVTTLLERYLLIRGGWNATRDHYISTTFLAVCLFVYVIQSGWRNKILAFIGRRYSMGLYLAHPIFITLLSRVVERWGLQEAYRYTAPVIVYGVTLMSLLLIHFVGFRISVRLSALRKTQI